MATTKKAASKAAGPAQGDAASTGDDDSPKGSTAASRSQKATRGKNRTVRRQSPMTGRRGDGSRWPDIGELLECSEAEAEQLISKLGVAVDPADDKS